MSLGEKERIQYNLILSSVWGVLVSLSVGSDTYQRVWGNRKGSPAGPNTFQLVLGREWKEVQGTVLGGARESTMFGTATRWHCYLAVYERSLAKSVWYLPYLVYRAVRGIQHNLKSSSL